MMHATLHVIISREIQTGAHTNCESVLSKKISQSCFFRARLLRKCAIWATVRDSTPIPGAFPEFHPSSKCSPTRGCHASTREKRFPGRPATTRTPAVA